MFLDGHCGKLEVRRPRRGSKPPRAQKSGGSTLSRSDPNYFRSIRKNVCRLLQAATEVSARTPQHHARTNTTSNPMDVGLPWIDHAWFPWHELSDYCRVPTSPLKLATRQSPPRIIFQTVLDITAGPTQYVAAPHQASTTAPEVWRRRFKRGGTQDALWRAAVPT